MVAVRLDDTNGLGVMSWGQRPGNGPPARTAVWEDTSNLTPGSPQPRDWRGLALHQSGRRQSINADGAERPEGSNNLPLR